MSHHAVLDRPRNQTPEHHALALLGFGWLWNYGCRCIAFEVPIGSWVFDVVGVRWPKTGRRNTSPLPEVYVVEAKGHRGDFRNEIARKARAERARDEYAASPGAKTRRAWEKHSDYAGRFGSERVIRAGKLWCPKVLAETTARFLIAPDGVIQVSELPPGWGLLSSKPAMVMKSAGGASTQDRVNLVLDHMARAATYRAKDALPGQAGGARVEMASYETLVRGP